MEDEGSGLGEHSPKRESFRRPSYEKRPSLDFGLQFLGACLNNVTDSPIESESLGKKERSFFQNRNRWSGI